MKIWTSPEMEEMDVRLTAKMPSTVEQNAHYDNGWQVATLNSATHEWNEEDDCLEPIKTGTGS